MPEQELTPEQQIWILNNAGDLIREFDIDISHNTIDSVQEKLNYYFKEELQKGNDLSQGDTNHNPNLAEKDREFEIREVPGHMQDYNNRDSSGSSTEQREPTTEPENKSSLQKTPKPSPFQDPTNPF